jgi:hypothetical protein
MGFPTKVQLINRKTSEEWYINFPSAIAQAMEFSKGETVEWIIEDKALLALRRQQRVADRAQTLALSSLLCLGRHTVTGLLAAHSGVSHPLRFKRRQNMAHHRSRPDTALIVTAWDRGKCGTPHQSNRLPRSPSPLMACCWCRARLPSAILTMDCCLIDSFSGFASNLPASTKPEKCSFHIASAVCYANG